MGFLSNFLKSSPTKKCPEGYNTVGINIAKGEPEKLSTNDKNRIMVQKVTTKDMMQFPNIPYQLNAPIQKELRKNAQPFAYIDLDEFNQKIAKRDLKMVNALIADAQKYIRLLSGDFQIDVTKVAFQQYNSDYGYSHIICTPYTFTGKIAKYPISLLFMTKMNSSAYTANGELFYEKGGDIAKGTVNIWRNRTGWLFSLKKVKNVLVISEAKTTLRPDKYGQPTAVYKIT